MRTRSATSTPWRKSRWSSRAARFSRVRRPSALLAALLAAGGALPGAARCDPAPDSVAQLEALYADFNDAQGAVALIDSDPARYSSYAGRTRAAWQHTYIVTRGQLLAGLAPERRRAASAGDARALRLMRADVMESPAVPESLAPAGRCSDARRANLRLRALQQALYACFAELANNLSFEGRTVTRVAAFDLLTRMPEAGRRRALF